LSTPETFLDSNVLVEFLLNKHTDEAERIRNLFRRVATQDEIIHLSATVLFEAAFVVTRRYDISREEAARAFKRLIALPGVRLPEPMIITDTLDLWVKETPLSFADCYHLMLTRHLGLDAIYTFDKKMGRLPDITRREP